MEEGVFMAYMALYRRWRPTIFEDVVGQEHISKTLKNQIKNSGIAHAYLFCGTRGTGKTSMSKIFAKAVNCLHPQDHNPCNQCEICKGIQHESIMDVIEIDAASNNGVDNIRELRENVKYPPTKGRYKVYIIDEVHMLSTGAFNALLKTLEEPPEFVIFILATTESHKIPATILSRCQRFDFKRISEKDIVKWLGRICNELNYETEEEALQLIARNSDGAMRDALSILDQCMAFSSEKVTREDVINILGTVTDEILFELVDHIIEGNSRNAMALIESLVQSGKDIHQFLNDLIGHYRNLMMTKIAGQQEGIIHLSNESIERLFQQGNKTEINHIMRAVRILSETEAESKWSTQPRVLLEVAIIKLTQPMYDYSMEGLVERISVLEKAIKSGSVHIKEKMQNPKPQEKSKVEIPPEVPKQEQSNKDKGQVLKDIPFEEIKNSWEEILKEIKKRKISVHAWVMEGKPATVEKDCLIISFEDRFSLHREASSKSPNKDFIEEVISEMVGTKVSIKCLMEEDIHTPETVISEVSSIEDDLKIKKLVELLGDDIVEIVE